MSEDYGCEGCARRLDVAQIAYGSPVRGAANFYTIQRTTRDIDVVVELAEEDLAPFWSFSSPTFT